MGDLHSVRCEVGHYLPYWRTNTDYRKSVSAQKILGGGVLLELSHEIDYLIWIFGSISKVNAFLTRHSSLEIDVEDTAYLRLELSNTHQEHNPFAILTMDFIRSDSTRACYAIGSEGTLKWDGISNCVEFWEKIIWVGKNCSMNKINSSTAMKANGRALLIVL